MISKSKYIGAVEIGTSKVSVLVGELTNGRSLHIIGFGSFPSRGIIKGTVVDFKTASEATHRAILDAQKSAGVEIGEVYLAQSGGHIEGFYNEASLNVAAADNMVSAADIENVCRLAMSKNLPEGRVVVHQLRRPYRLDGRLVPDPEHLVGRRLETAYWTVHGALNKVADHMHVIRGFRIHVTELVLAGIASGSFLTTAEDRQNGVLVIDIGAGTTDYALYRDGCVQVAGVVPVGGSHLTNDIALGLRLTEGQAEKLKHRYGRAIIATKDRSEKVWLNGDFAIGDRQFPRQTIEQITSVRTWEIFEVVRKKLGSAFTPETVPAGILLTGGTAHLPAIDETASRVFGLAARVAESPSWVKEDLRDPGYSTVLGLLHHGLNTTSEAPPPRREGVGGLFKKLFA